MSSGAGSSDVVAWARRWARRPEAAEHELLEVTAAATLEIVRGAYHKLARFAHPDLHRATLSAAELEEVTESFARVSNAYSMLTARLRKAGATTGSMPAMAARPGTATRATPASAASTSAASTSAASTSAASGGRNPGAPPASAPRSTTAPATESRHLGGAATASPAPRENPAASTPTQGPRGASIPSKVPVTTTGPATGLSSKAMLHYRRAELCLRRGELIEAKLHLRLALAADPQSAFLRKALDELDRQ